MELRIDSALWIGWELQAWKKSAETHVKDFMIRHQRMLLGLRR